jgi:hypothetical protein
VTERQIAERARLRDVRIERRRHPKPPKAECKRLHPRPPRVLLTPEQRAGVSRANLKKATESRQSKRLTPAAIRTVWWLSKS